MSKTHRVRLGGQWTYERPYPNAPTFAFRAPAGSVITMPDEAYQAIKRMNDTPGRPTLKLESVDDSEPITEGGDLVALIEAYEAEVGAAGRTTSKNPPAPMVFGRGKNMVKSYLANAQDQPKEEEPDGGAAATAKTKGGK